jgi:signal transduction histidine kinase
VPDALAKDIDLGFEGTPDALVHGDADSLGEMLSNLIDNAIRYTQAGGHITVSVKRDPQGTTLQVEDNGPGIPEDQRELVLQRFYRILGSGQSGSGLGLAIASEVARRHGTELELGAGEGGAGTRVSVRFQVPAGN